MGGYTPGETPDKTSSSPDAYNITSPSQGTDSNRSLKRELSDLEKAEINANVDIKEQKNNKNKSIDVGTKTDSIDVTERSIGTSEFGRNDDDDFVWIVTPGACSVLNLKFYLSAICLV